MRNLAGGQRVNITQDSKYTTIHPTQNHSERTYCDWLSSHVRSEQVYGFHTQYNSWRCEIVAFMGKSLYPPCFEAPERGLESI